MRTPLAFALLALTAVSTLRAADGSWALTTAGTGNWGTDTNWTGNVIANGSGSTATFTSGTTGSFVVSLDTARTIGNLTFGNHAWTLSGANTLTLAGSSTPTIIAPTQGTTISTVLDGTQGFTLTSGLLTLSGNNIYTGTTTVSGSNTVLTLSHNKALGSTTGGTTVSNGAALIVGNNITVTGETLTLTGVGGTNSPGALRVADGTSAEWAGPITINATTRITAGASNLGSGNLKVSGIISGSADLDISGLGTTTFTAANLYAGHTRVYRGTLKLDTGNNRLPTGTALIIGGTSNNATVNLNGYDQTVAVLRDNAPTVGAGLRTLTNDAATASVFTVNQTSGTETFSGIISGDIALVKSGAGTLSLTGTANTFTGNITINGGTLGIASASINNVADVSLFSGAVFNLNFTGTDTIGGLYFNGEAQQIGTYGSIVSTATYKSAFFTGSGILNVTSYTAPIPEPATCATLFGAVILGASLTRRRRG